MIKSKISNSKEEIEKEIKNQQVKRERIKQAYINGSFTLEEHDKEVKYVDDTIAELERQILEQEQVKELKFTPEDILIKRDMDFINQVKLPMLYKAIVECWEDKFEKLISFLHNKLHSWYDKDDKYVDVVNEMYEDNVLDDDDIEELDFSKEKDDFER